MQFFVVFRMMQCKCKRMRFIAPIRPPKSNPVPDEMRLVATLTGTENLFMCKDLSALDEFIITAQAKKPPISPVGSNLSTINAMSKLGMEYPWNPHLPLGTTWKAGIFTPQSPLDGSECPSLQNDDRVDLEFVF